MKPGNRRRRRLFRIERQNWRFLLVLTMLCAVVACHDAATSSRVESSAPANNEAGALPPARTGPLPIKLTAVDGQDIRFRRLPGGTGLSQTRVGWVVQDNLGFIWFATQYGLNRYDGYRSKVFKHEPGRSNSLGCVYIRSLFRIGPSDLPLRSLCGSRRCWLDPLDHGHIGWSDP
jgi:hypothetical protein